MGQRIIDYIPVGKTNAKHLQALAAELEKPVYIVKKMIQQARENNVILSGCKGYWLPESQKEFETWLQDHNQIIFNDTGVRKWRM